jgi:hypothetical protein
MTATIFLILLIIHVICGFTALASALGAMIFKKGYAHHRLCGKFFITAMTGILITAIPMSIIKSDIFLFLIAIFSYYLAFSGWRFAKNRSGIAAKIDWLVSLAMLITGCSMITFGLYHFDENNYQKTVILIFGIIGTITSISDLKIYFTQKATGVERIIKHLTAMLGATIAATTAFLVTNIHIEPKIIVWLAPTAFITPIIIWWKRKISLSGNQYK